MVRKNISIIIPVFNSAGSLKELNERIIIVLNNLQVMYEIIYVNDGSNDNSNEVLEKLRHDNKTLNLISLTKNYGQHNAILCGIREAAYDTIVTLDDDLQRFITPSLKQWPSSNNSISSISRSETSIVFLSLNL